MEGSLVGVFLGTVIMCYVNLCCMGLLWWELKHILAYAALAAVVEGTAPVGMDNILLPLVLRLSFERVQQCLP